MKKSLLAALLVATAAWSYAQAPAAPAAAPAASPVVKVEKIVVATGVQDREPTGEGTAFDAAIPEVFCWVKLSATETPANIKFVWSMDGKQVHEHPMEIKTAGRWWATKKVAAGAWKVEVLTDSGENLGSVEFKVGGAAPAALGQ